MARRVPFRPAARASWRSNDAVHAVVLAPRPRLHGRVLLPRPARARALPAARRAPGARGTPLRAFARQARVNALSWRLLGRADRRRLPGRRVVRGRDTGAARAHRSGA